MSKMGENCAKDREGFAGGEGSPNRSSKFSRFFWEGASVYYSCLGYNIRLLEYAIPAPLSQKI